MRQFEIRYTSTAGTKEVDSYRVENNDLAPLRACIEDKRKMGVTDIALYELKNIEMLGRHECLYCGGLADGEDEDVLCDDCRETFGHTYYHEL